MKKRNKSESAKFADRFKQIRKMFQVPQGQMAIKVGVTRTTYTRYESGELLPGRLTLIKLAKLYNISMDWLLLNKGPMLYKEKEGQIKEDQKNTALKKDKQLEWVRNEAEEMLEYMSRYPMFHHEMLTHFHRFKLENKDLVEPSAEEGERP
ncbi:MAG: helix-turn-helix transcriptional regulator [bacterium]|nr:helix-turn-helix transcriptional regulator [bacterium]